ncbi:Transcription factor CBF/NF-Y/archaeal histone domain and Histone-fold domain-containing protein [Strongyloides ratti]|uniref:Transcription factor CBF/NF-Y/archaeal histone domain and Histone-fold domain-containing protein n=1 Tax=Strongyloides ratti TaxID=34506 RepID=A0A090L7P2_STRRB|nr:Transcription factor CBF/NF-Y/archaeal histone domain and Histone-fold domain-containing protein [Strongyloides ratti]CEF65816.1 Transcription factor CBF/NF-Y/archaeal histone domain and Histone-fold domain-containing protein [Strongyloides ratti]
MEDNTNNDSNKIVKQKFSGQQTIFPLARVKKIAKHIPNVTLIAPEVITAMSYVTEKFIEILAEEAFRNAGMMGRKTVTRKDIDAVIESSLSFKILENCIDDLEEVEKINTISEVLDIESDNDDGVVDPDGNDDIVQLEEELSTKTFYICILFHIFLLDILFISIKRYLRLFLYLMDIGKSKKVFLFKCKNCRKINGFFSSNLPEHAYCVVDKRNGIVYSFWNNGISKECASFEWAGCVETFNLIETNKSKSMDDFLIFCGNYFKSNMYNCSTWNCFDFVLAFLNYYGYPLRYLSKEVFIRKIIIFFFLQCVLSLLYLKRHMAEFLESDDNNDNDRLMDRKSFNREQFRLFKESFRDYVEVEETVEYDDNVNVFDYISNSNKKKIINLILKMEKLEKKTDDDVVRKKASDFLKQLRESVSLIPTAGEELSQDDINLKKFDEIDINLLLGEQFVEKNGKGVVLEALTKYKEKCLHELEILLKESEDFLKNNKNLR